MPRKRTRKVGRRSDAAKLKPNIGDHFPVTTKKTLCAMCSQEEEEKNQDNVPKVQRPFVHGLLYVISYLIV